MKLRISFLLIFILALFALPAAAQKGSKGGRAPAAAVEIKPAFDLSIDSIMRGSGLYGYEPRGVRWSANSEKIYFEWKAATDPREKDWDTWAVNRDGSELRKLSEEEAKVIPPMSGALGGFGGGGRGAGGGGMDRTKDKKWGVYAESGDMVLYELATGTRRKLTSTSESESNPRFTRDGRHVTFVRANNLYKMSLDSGEIEQLTDIRSGSTPSSAGGPPSGMTRGFGMGREGSAAASSAEQQKGTESQEYLKKEEKELIDYVKRLAAKREEDAAKRKKQTESERKPYTLQGRQAVMGFQLTPDEKYVLLSINEPAEGSKSSIVPNYVTESAYVEDIPARGKVGDTQGRTRMAVVDVKTGDLKFVETGLKPLTEPSAGKTEATPTVRPDAEGNAGDTPLVAPSAGEAPDAEYAPGPAQSPARPQQGGGGQAGQGGRRPALPPERDVTLSMPVWSEDGKRAVLNCRSADFKDRWIMALDPDAAKVRILTTDHDDAWIGSGGSGTVGWMKDGQTIYFQSERTGHTHLYVMSYEGGEPHPLTSGTWEVQSARLSEDMSRFYLSTSEGSPFEVHYYSMPSSGGERTRITSMTGHHNVTLSPDEKWLADIHSFSNRPPELYVLENKPEFEAKKITTSPLPEFWNYPWIDPPIVQVPARDGVMVPARMYKPRNWKPGGPGVIFVHGAGYTQNVHKWWSSYSQVYLYHHFLMEHGYLVLDVDYRASAGYGRDWRTAIYRHMGGKDLDDHVDAAKWMAKEHRVDPRRIGIYGGSYGGFMTLMAMFNAPDVFAAGAAMRPVTDWAHYSHGYTGGILNLPQNDPEAYRRSSPIYFAQNLKGALLICHGIVDTNVFFEDTARLVQRLIELRKENWELAVYPVEDHSFVEPTSWADQYKRVFRLFETNLKRPLPTEPVAKSRATTKR